MGVKKIYHINLVGVTSVGKGSKSKGGGTRTYDSKRKGGAKIGGGGKPLGKPGSKAPEAPAGKEPKGKK